MQFRTAPRVMLTACLAVSLAIVAFIDTTLPLSRSVLAQEEQPRQLNPGEIDTGLSWIYVFVGKRRLGHEHAVAGRVQEGEIHSMSTSDPGRIVFDMTSFTADTDAAREYVGLEGTTDEDEQNDVTSTMTGSKVLDVEEYPTATFEITSIEKLDEQTDDGHQLYEFSGELTLHGEKKNIEFRAATTEERDNRVRLQGDFVIKQSDFGIKPYSAFFGAVAVTDELKIYGDLWIATE